MIPIKAMPSLIEMLMELDGLAKARPISIEPEKEMS
jgi:hypothetical protein